MTKAKDGMMKIELKYKDWTILLGLLELWFEKDNDKEDTLELNNLIRTIEEQMVHQM